MADEVAAVAETVAPAKPKMRVKLTFSHPTNIRPKVKMAKVDGCTFFRSVVTEGRGDEASTKTVWRHVDNSCERTDHWTWTIRLSVNSFRKATANIETLDGAREAEAFHIPKIGEMTPPSKLVSNNCTLIRSGGKWQHNGAPCAAAAAYLDAENKATTHMKAEEEAKCTGKKLDAKMVMEGTQLLQKLEKTEKPACVSIKPEFMPVSVGGCSFWPQGDVLYHLDRRCKLKEHSNSVAGVGMVHLTRSPGRTNDEFAAKANEAIGQALALVPPNSGKHVAVEL